MRKGMHHIQFRGFADPENPICFTTTPISSVFSFSSHCIALRGWVPAPELLSHIWVGRGVGFVYTYTHALRELEASGVAVTCLPSRSHLHSCCPIHSPFRTPKFVQISDHGELGPGYREGTDNALEEGWLSEHKKYSYLNIFKIFKNRSVLNNLSWTLTVSFIVVDSPQVFTTHSTNECDSNGGVGGSGLRKTGSCRFCFQEPSYLLDLKQVGLVISCLK